MKKFIKFALLGSLLLSCSSFATNRWHTGNITYLYPLGNGTVIIYMDSSNQYCLNSAGTPKQTFYLALDKGPTKVTEFGHKNIYSSALTAFATGKKLRVYFDDTTTGCYIDRILMHRD